MSDSLDFEREIKRFGSKIVVFAFIFLNNLDPELDRRTLDKKISMGHAAVESFKLIEATHKENIVNPLNCTVK